MPVKAETVDELVTTLRQLLSMWCDFAADEYKKEMTQAFHTRRCCADDLHSILAGYDQCTERLTDNLQVIEKDGKREYVIVPYGLWREIMCFRSAVIDN
jgi:hypothetical protein